MVVLVFHANQYIYQLAFILAQFEGVNLILAALKVSYLEQKTI
ncbi:hypothetical protein PPEP_a1913 [Pseudoalteromonas peptidolytica F12-50-A1]|uniref:Uncharacterized protein n=1 Tax=Pseudoalteromonas peptidolytica F12-50-A1 TaxID=1315280 RepID=A0A8I0MWY3_9GAMM|nr:hypothetical protein [Pseudoalteromonas peptidolytica F12-50-A1]